MTAKSKTNSGESPAREVHLPARPKKAGRAYVFGLLRFCFIGGTPDSVLNAVFEVLCANDVLEHKKGHVEICDQPGMTLEYPQIAIGALKDSITECALASESWGLLLGLMRGSGASGTGSAGGSFSGGTGCSVEGHGDSRSRLERSDELRRIAWNRDCLIEGFGDGVRSQATVIVDYVIESRRSRPVSVMVDAANPGAIRESVTQVTEASKFEERQPGTAGGDRPTKRKPAPTGWIWLVDASEEFGVKKSTLHDYAQQLPAGARHKDEDSNMVRVERNALEDLLRRKRGPSPP